jgi:hypothetical protein
MGPTIAEGSGGAQGGKEGGRERESLIGTMLHNRGNRAPTCTSSASPYADLRGDKKQELTGTKTALVEIY